MGSKESLNLWQCSVFCTGGKHSQNIERDLHRLSTKHFNFPVRPYNIEVPKFHRKTGKVKPVVAAIICPHELFGAINRDAARFEGVFGKPMNWVKFWYFRLLMARQRIRDMLMLFTNAILRTTLLRIAQHSITQYISYRALVPE